MNRKDEGGAVPVESTIRRARGAAREGPARRAGRAGDGLTPAGRGAWGERLAEAFLKRSLGCRIVARNWRSPLDRRDEIDLVVLDGGALAFVEVKTRAAGAKVPGVFAVDARKRRALRRAARAYLSLLAEPPRTYRLDVVEVTAAASGPEIRHYENVGLFSGRHFP